MAQFTISLDPAAARLYLQVARAAGKPVEEVLADALFKLCLLYTSDAADD